MGWTKGITTCEHRRYTEPIKNDCVMLYNKGYSIDKIGNILGIHRTTVYKYVRSKGVICKGAKKHSRELVENVYDEYVINNCDAKETAERLGITEQEVKYIVSYYGLIKEGDIMTQKQRELLLFIKDYTEMRKYAPSLKDMADYFGKYRSTMFNRVSILIEKGWLGHDAYIERSYYITDKGMSELRKLGLIN